MAEYICEKILPADAYNTQLEYLQERTKPSALPARKWWLRLQTLNRYLPMMMKTVAALRIETENPNANINNLRRDGSLTTAQLRRVIRQKMPQVWKDKVVEYDTTGALKKGTDVNELIEYLTTLETAEQQQRTRNSRRMAGNRRTPERPARHYNQGRRQQFLLFAKLLQPVQNKTNPLNF